MANSVKKPDLIWAFQLYIFATIASKLGVNLDGKVAVIPQSTVPKADDYIASAAQKNEKGDFSGALADLDRAIQIKPSATAYAERGYLRSLRLNDFKGGVGDLDRALQLKPNVYTATEIYAARGILRATKLNDLKCGLGDIDRAIQLNSSSANLPLLR